MALRKILLLVIHSAVLKIIITVTICAAIPQLFLKLLPPRTNIIPAEWFSILNLVVILGTYFFVFWLWDKRRIKELGFRLFGLNSVVAFFIGFAAIGIVVLFLFTSGNYKINSNNEVNMLIGTCLFFLMMSAAEEVITRGILYRITEEKIGTNLALIISSVLFSLLHLRNSDIGFVSFLILFLGGILLGLVYTNTKSLWAVIFAHMGWNFAQYFFGGTVSGSKRLPKFFNADFGGPEWMHGGGYGLENSYITLFVLLILIFFFYRKSKLNGKFIPFPRPGKQLNNA